MNTTFFIILISFSISVPIWQVDFLDVNIEVNPDQILNKVHIMNGRYSTIKAIIKENPESEIHTHSQTYLSILDTTNKYQTPKKNYYLDTREARRFDIEIGVSCGESDPSTPINITFSSSSDEFKISSIEIMFTVEEPTTIPFHINGITVPRKGFGYLSVSQDNLRNVEEIKIYFTPSESTKGKAFADTFVIKPYEGKDEYSKNLYSKFGMIEDTDIKEQVFTITYDDKCFTGQNQLVFNYDKNIIIPNPKKLVNTLVKTSLIVDNGIQSTLNVELNIAVAPVMANCVLQDMDSEFITDEEIINRSKPVDLLHLQYYISLFSAKGIYLISFNRVSQFLAYKMKCVFTPTTMDTEQQKEKAVVTFGYFDDADVKISLDSDDVEPTPAHCMTWIFKKKVNEADFVERARNYCYASFSDPILPRTANGCIECVQRDVTGVFPVTETQSLISICAKSKDNCESKYISGNFTEDFKSFSGNLDTSEKIRKNLELTATDYEIDNIYYENDNKIPDSSKIFISDFSLTNNEVHFKAYTKEDKKVECYAIAQQRSDLLISPYEFVQKFTLDNNLPSNTFSIKFKTTEYDSMLYNLIFQCYNIPKFDYNFKHTEAFTIAQFIREANAKPKETIIRPLNCKEENNKFSEQCVIVAQQSLIGLQTEIPLLEHSDGYKEFRKRNPAEKGEYLVSEANKLSSIQTVYGVLEKIIFINDLLSVTLCKTFIDFSACRKTKIKVQEIIIDIISKISNNIIEKIKDDNEEIKEKNAKIVFLALFNILNNPDSFNLSGTESMILMMNNIYQKFNDILNLFSQKQEIKNDLTKLYLGSMNNLIDILKFNEVDEASSEAKTLQIDKNTNFILNINYTIIPEIFANFSSYLSQINIENFGLSHVSYNIISLNQLKGASYYNISLFSETVDVSIPLNYLSKARGIAKIGIVSYTNYPLLSFKIYPINKPPALSIIALSSTNQRTQIRSLPDENPFIIYFNQLKSRDFQYCYYFDWKDHYSPYKSDEDMYRDLGFHHDGVVTNQTLIEQASLSCITSHLTDFTIGTYDIYGKIFTAGMSIWAIILITALSVAAAIIVIVIIVKIIMKHKNRGIDEQINSEIDNVKLLGDRDNVSDT